MFLKAEHVAIAHNFKIIDAPRMAGKNIFAGSLSLNKKQSLKAYLKLLKFEDSETFPFVNSPKINHSPKFERNIENIRKLSRCGVVSANIWANNTNILAARSPPLHIRRWKKCVFCVCVVLKYNIGLYKL